MRIYIHYDTVDDLSSRIAGARALYERGGTPGERQAALEALKRMGAEPRVTGIQKKQRWNVTVSNGASVVTTYRGVEASSQGEAEAEIIKRTESLWSRTSKTGTPRFTARAVAQ